MATRIRSEHLEPRTSDTLDYYAAEGIPRPEPEPERARREGPMVAAGLAGLIALLAVVLGAFALAKSGSGETATVVKQAPRKTAAAAPAKAPTLAAAKGIKFEPFEKVDPTLPAVPAGAVKKFTVHVSHHVPQVPPQLPPTEAWRSAVNGPGPRGPPASPPMVVTQGDKVEITF